MKKLSALALIFFCSWAHASTTDHPQSTQLLICPITGQSYQSKSGFQFYGEQSGVDKQVGGAFVPIDFSLVSVDENNQILIKAHDGTLMSIGQASSGIAVNSGLCMEYNLNLTGPASLIVRHSESLIEPPTQTIEVIVSQDRSSMRTSCERKLVAHGDSSADDGGCTQ